MDPKPTRRTLLSRPLDHLLAALQDPGDADRRVFPKLFPNPTGQNGWEDFVLASDALLGVSAIEQAQEAASTLTVRRNALGHPSVRRALALVRTGLTKPIVSPRTQLDFATTFPDLAGFRKLARLLAIEQQVLFADGRPGGALDAFRVGVRLAEVPKSEALIGGLVGVACGALAMTRCVAHLESAPARECDGLAAFLRQYLAADDRTLVTLAAERRGLESALVLLEKDPEALKSLLGGDEDDGANPEAQAELRRVKRDLETIAGDPARRAALARDARAAIDQHFQRLAAQLAAPWKDLPPAVPDDELLGNRIAGMLLPMFPSVDRFSESRAQATLLLGHTLIRRYRWEHDRVPASLDDLKAGESLTDPFSRKPLVYVRHSDLAYELESVGPAVRDEKGNPVPGARRAVRLPNARPKNG